MAGNEDLVVVNAFVEELARAGVRDFCISPGSRSTPLTLAIARYPSLRIWSLLDERSAGYFAYGLARRQQAPVALICTSGTATANYLPAVMEAHQSRVPLLILTADRPPELQGVGANQTVDQLKLYGSHVKLFLQMPVPQNQDMLLRQARQAAWRVVLGAKSVPQGPVHLNWPFREPLVPPDYEPASSEALSQDNAGGQLKPALGALVEAYPASQIMDALTLEHVSELAKEMTRGLIVCGPQDDVQTAEAIYRLAQHLNIPILADPLSQLRTRFPQLTGVVDTYDILFRDETWYSKLQPDVIFRFGQIPTSKVLGRYLQAQEQAWQVVVDENPAFADSFFTATHVVTSNPGHFCAAVMERVPTRLTSTGWFERWNNLNRRVSSLVTEAFELEDVTAGLFEGRIPQELIRALPDETTILVGNSMPVRDFDSFLYSSGRKVRLLGNRGVSGIDGVVSTALGLSAGGVGPVVLVIGDVSFYHDLNALLAARRNHLSLLIVLVHNDGGGIFSFLPQAAYPETFHHFRTSHGLDFRSGVEMYGGQFYSASTWGELQNAVEQWVARPDLSIVELRTDGEKNVSLHQQVFQYVLSRIKGEW